MDAEEFRDSIEAARETELARLGSDRRLVAETDADLSRERVLAAAYEKEALAVSTFTTWAETETDASVATVFDEVAKTERGHRDRLGDALDDTPTNPSTEDVHGLHGYLRELDDTRERVAAGLVARPLIGSRTLLQFVNFFVNEADRTAAELFRDLRADTDAQLDDGLSLIAEVCTDGDDWDRAERAALEAIDVVYEQYASSLAAMGLDPKPVC